ncbi:hypothetical protein AB0J37_03515 [Microbispora rosea]|uniref:hypothetical protein n=1 Tax=Microbispora rosea TaxID=58117 RepID=UPI003447DA8A
MKRILPYPIVLGELLLEIREVRLDDVALPIEMISAEHRTVALHRIERSGWRTARLAVTVRGPRDELDTGPWRSMSCLVTLTERRTNAHTAVKLGMTSELGVWSGHVDLHRDEHVGKAELTACLVATIDGIAGREIAVGNNPWLVDLQAKTPAKRDDVITRWVDFNDEAYPWLRPYRADPWTVDTSSESPTLYLNSGFEGLRLLLNSPRSADHAAKDALASRIAMDMWNVLFDTAAENVKEWPGGWRESVLRRMLPDVFPDLSPEDALRELANAAGGALRARVLHAAAKQARMPAALGTYIRSVRDVEQEDG